MLSPLLRSAGAASEILSHEVAKSLSACAKNKAKAMVDYTGGEFSEFNYTVAIVE